MSLEITSSEVRIHNSSGAVKFNSSNKLVYPRTSKTGTITLTTSSINIPFSALGESEFLILTFKINSCTGNVGSALIDIEIPANGSVITNFYGRSVNNVAAADTDYIGALLIQDQLVFKGIKFNYTGVSTNSTITTNLTYRATIYSYL